MLHWHWLLPGGSLGEKPTSTQQVQPSANGGAVVLMVLGEEVSAPRLWVLLSCAWGGPAGRGHGQAEGRGGVLLNGAKVDIPKPCFGWQIRASLNSCSHSELMKILK